MRGQIVCSCLAHEFLCDHLQRVSVTGVLLKANSGREGGGVFVTENGQAGFESCLVLGNIATAASGGGLFASAGSDVSLNSCVFQENKADAMGGAIAVQVPGDAIASQPLVVPSIAACTFNATNTAARGPIAAVFPSAAAGDCEGVASMVLSATALSQQQAASMALYQQLVGTHQLENDLACAANTTALGSGDSFQDMPYVAVESDTGDHVCVPALASSASTLAWTANASQVASWMVVPGGRLPDTVNVYAMDAYGAVIDSTQSIEVTFGASPSVTLEGPTTSVVSNGMATASLVVVSAPGDFELTAQSRQLARPPITSALTVQPCPAGTCWPFASALFRCCAYAGLYVRMTAQHRARPKPQRQSVC